MRASTRTNLVLFDAFDTLLKPRHPIPNQYSDVFLKHGINLKPDVIKSSFKVAFVDLNKKASNYGKSISWTPNQWWSTLIRMVIEDNVNKADSRLGKLSALNEFIYSMSVNRRSLQSIQDELLARFAGSEGYEAFEGSYETCESGFRNMYSAQQPQYRPSRKQVSNAGWCRIQMRELVGVL